MNLRFKTLRKNIINTIEIFENESGCFELICFDTKSKKQKSNILIYKEDARNILEFMNNKKDNKRGIIK
jgi:hypothetical protein